MWRIVFEKLKFKTLSSKYELVNSWLYRIRKSTRDYFTRKHKFKVKNTIFSFKIAFGKSGMRQFITKRVQILFFRKRINVTSHLYLTNPQKSKRREFFTADKSFVSEIQRLSFYRKWKRKCEMEENDRSAIRGKA